MKYFVIATPDDSVQPVGVQSSLNGPSGVGQPENGECHVVEVERVDLEAGLELWQLEAVTL